MEKRSLTDMFLRMLDCSDSNPDIQEKIFETISEAPDSGERDGLLALIHHEGIGVPVDLDKSFEYAEKAAFQGGDPLGYYVLGYMCDKAETPDQAEGGPRQKYDHYDAERFYEKCAEKDGPWKRYACNWLGSHFLDMARGGDPELGVEYLEMVADTDAEAAGRLSDYYRNLVMPDYTDYVEESTYHHHSQKPHSVEDEVRNPQPTQPSPRIAQQPCLRMKQDPEGIALKRSLF